MWDTIKCNSIGLMGVPKDERERKRKNMQGNNGCKLHKLLKNNNLRRQKAKQNPSRITREEILKQIHSERIVKVKDKEKILKTTRER